MKKILLNDAKTKTFLESLPKIYAIGCWAGFGVRTFPFSGKCDEDGMPYVYDYFDGNGLFDEFHLVKLDDTTTGTIYAWTTNVACAKRMAEYCNIAIGEPWRNA